MTQPELEQAMASGNAQVVDTGNPSATTPAPASSSPAPESAPSAAPIVDEQYEPILEYASTPQPTLTSPPVNAPKSLLEQLQFYFDGSKNWLYFYSNMAWNAILAGSKFDFGDGSDGALVFDGSTTILGIVPSASTYTLNRDIFASAITVNVGVTVYANGYKIFSQTALSVSGTISVAGGDGGNGGDGGSRTSAGWGAAGTAGLAGTGIPSGTIKQPGNGVAGGAGGAGEGGASTPNGNNGSNETNSFQSNPGVAGGDGGSGQINPGTGFGANGGTHGSGGTVTQTTKMSASAIALAMANFIAQIGSNPGSGSGAGGGGGNGTHGSADASAGGGGGGGSGAPAGVLWICAPGLTINATGLIDLHGGKGGNGGNGGTASGSISGGNYPGGGGGGGGGGNGGYLIAITNTPIVNNGTIDMDGGSLGTGGTGYVNGSNGVAGHTGATFNIIVS